MEQHGWRGRRCAHFDFGAQLRLAATIGPRSGLAPEQLDVVRAVLTSGALLEDGQFGIARSILCRFLRERLPEGDGLLVLNGLPRHAGQAEAMESTVAVRAIISLECTAEVVRQRIAVDAGGDRGGRNDDDLPLIRQKLDIFAQRAAPLLRHYRDRGVPIAHVRVQAQTSALALHAKLQQDELTR